ncbi:MAG: TonB family protein [Ferruginibacter sp.]|nr:TonB family protein [Cytophagales bacterium]
MKLAQYHQTLPSEKVYLHFDKPFYTPGDDIWFKAYLRDGSSHEASATSGLLYAELINPKGNVEKTLHLVALGGHAKGDFHLDESAPGGAYKVRAYTQWMKNFGEAGFFEKEIPVQTVLLPRLRMKLDFERKAYGAADPVSADLVLSTLENRPLANFPFTFTAQLGGKAWTRGKGQTDAAGLARVAFELPRKLETNDGLLNVLFDYQGSTESISRSVPIVLNRIDVQFFPEGGELVENVEGRVAFKALNEFGKPADIRGLVLDGEGNTVTELISYHQGMGAFALKPAGGQSYRVKITQPAGIGREYALPRALPKGYALAVNPTDADKLRVRIVSPVDQPASLVAQVRGKVYFTQPLKPAAGETTVEVPTRDFPAGVVQLTLFDHRSVARCERLVFVNPHRQLRIEVSTDKPQYLPREKVAMTIRVTDEDGLPAPANLSLSVVDDKLISFADDKQDHILSYLLLSSDLKGKVEEPDFYFQPDEPKAGQALDYLLMTQGWRRFEWKEVLNGSPETWKEKIVHGPEKATLRGKVLRSANEQPIRGAKVTVLETEESTTTDAEGRFLFTRLDLSTPRTLRATTDDGFSRIIQVNDYAPEYRLGNEVSGQVLSDDKEPLPGVSVVVKGTTIGTVTDPNGHYRLPLPTNGSTLVFAFIGFVVEEVPIGAKSVVNVSLNPDVRALQEMAVVGFGVRRRAGNILPFAPPGAARQEQRRDKALPAPRDFAAPVVAEAEKMPAIEKKRALNERMEDDEVAFEAPAARMREPNVAVEQLYALAEQMPEFVGGHEQLVAYLTENIQYPGGARTGVEGTVYVGFIIGKEGAVSDVHVLKGIDSDHDREAARLIAGMPKWKPGEQNGQATSVRYTLPVRFNLDEYQKNNPGGLLLRVASPAGGLPAQQAKYYRARTFYAPVYESDEKVETRTDFRQTLYWNPDVTVGKTGDTTVSFHNSDEITTFRATVEGIAGNGSVGRRTATYYTQLPFSLSTKVPAVLAFDDQVSVPIILKNNTDRTLRGTLSVAAPAGLTATHAAPTVVEVAPNGTTTLSLDYQVGAKAGQDRFTIRFESGGLSDAFEQPVEIKAKGFPVVASFSGNELDRTYSLEIKDLINGSLTARFVAYPDVLTDLMAGVESILQEPYGCFEQTSSSTYPNILALQYMRESGVGDPAIRARAAKLIEKGYQRLTSFETREKGYEWFGSVPAHEGLTAYGLMEFKDMGEVYAGVDPKMVSRTADWMLARRDGKGGFQQNSQSLDQFGSASPAVANAYIAYALSEAGYSDIGKELAAASTKALETKDAYQLALVANGLLNLKQFGKAQTVLSELRRQVAAVGVQHLKANHSITRSAGKSLQVETASLVALALLKEEKMDVRCLQDIVRFLAGARGNSGGFGSTQATILALKALTEYAKFAKQTADSGTVEIYRGDQKIAAKPYEKGTRGEIVVEGLEKYLGEGTYPLSVRFAHTKTALPYSLDVRWSTYVPRSQPECQVALTTAVLQTPARVGETVRLTTTLKNQTDQGLPMTVALVGIPSGLSAQPWQLKELREKGRVDFYEVQKNYVVFYYRSLAPAAQHEIVLDLKAEIPGTYEAPASSAYLYYTNEFKTWAGGERVVITGR